MKIAKGIFLTTGLLALGASLSASVTAQTIDPLARATIKVRAIYRDTERPVRRAAVQIFSEELPRVARLEVTDGRGEFILKS